MLDEVTIDGPSCMMNLVKISDGDVMVGSRLASSENGRTCGLLTEESSSGISSIAERTPCSSDGENDPFANDGKDENAGAGALIREVEGVGGIDMPVWARRRN